MNPTDLLAQIEFEQKQLEREHFHYSIDQEPEICARLIAQAIRGVKSSKDIKDDMKQAAFELGKQVGQMFSDTIAEAFTGRRMYTTVSNWDDAELAIKRMCDRWRELRRK